MQQPNYPRPIVYNEHVILTGNGAASLDNVSSPLMIPSDRYLHLTNVFADASPDDGLAVPVTTAQFALLRVNNRQAQNVLVGWHSNFQSQQTDIILMPGEQIFVHWAIVDTTQPVTMTATLHGRLYQLGG